MKKDRPPAHGPREEAYQFSYDLARKQLAETMDLEEQCRKSGAHYHDPEKITLSYLNRTYRITLPAVDLSLENGDAEVALTDRILILHYFNRAKGTPATGRMVTFKQLPGGISYDPAFSQRVVRPLVSRFGKRTDLLAEAAARYAGYPADHGDVSVTVPGFPRVPVTLVLWKGDEEVAPSGNMLFDANISDYLHTEDVTVLCGNLVWGLIRELPSG